MSKLDEIKQALEAATLLFPDPWERDEHINQIYCVEDRGAVVADPRGWGHLTGTLGLDPNTAVEAQKANARLIVEAVNNLPKFLKAVEAARTLHVVCQTLMNSDSEDEHVTLDELDAYDEASDALREALEALNDD
jgi:hypothetical protein